ncbi:hypothetical protein RO575_08585 [Methylomonas sp. MO1]|uniref:hypothetical protein n=1 Tax=Methylomonas sp. MO1 TaxID=3073619 RepID=UPI0028A4CAB6|nr:hypothetical protein [Methylomonas sp. MO1]MDT4289613.1 hypothetical protein [Methylomonas sp. MO1]
MTHRIFYFCIAAFFTIIGIWLSCIKFLDDNTWLARSGSLIVVFAILSVFSSISERRTSTGIFKLNALVTRLKVDRVFSPKQIEETNIQNLLDAKEKQFEKELSNELEDAAYNLEAALLIFGTMLWGFGDLPFKLLSK